MELNALVAVLLAVGLVAIVVFLDLEKDVIFFVVVHDRLDLIDVR